MRQTESRTVPAGQGAKSLGKVAADGFPPNLTAPWQPERPTPTSTIMLNFGTSAFLKLLYQNAKPQRRTIRERVSSTGDGGYDFHRSLRLRVQQRLVEDASLSSILATIDQITREAERNSVHAGMEQLEDWRRDYPGAICSFSSVVYESPAGLFSVSFKPDFGVQIGQRSVAVHVWNTKQPELIEHFTYGALALFRPLYEGGNQPDELAVLSLRDARLHRLEDVAKYAALGEELAFRIDNLIQKVRDDLGLPDTDEHSPEPRP